MCPQVLNLEDIAAGLDKPASGLDGLASERGKKVRPICLFRFFSFRSQFSVCLGSEMKRFVFGSWYRFV